MDSLEEPSEKMPLFLKTVILALVGLFVVIGLIGLLLPIIPGILFLALAAWLLAKVSGRFAFHLNQNSAWNKLKRHLRSIRSLSFAQQAKLSLLLLCRSVVDGLDRLAGAAKAQRPK